MDILELVARIREHLDASCRDGRIRDVAVRHGLRILGMLNAERLRMVIENCLLDVSNPRYLLSLDISESECVNVLKALQRVKKKMSSTLSLYNTQHGNLKADGMLSKSGVAFDEIINDCLKTVSNDHSLVRDLHIAIELQKRYVYLLYEEILGVKSRVLYSNVHVAEMSLYTSMLRTGLAHQRATGDIKTQPDEYLIRLQAAFNKDLEVIGPDRGPLIAGITELIQQIADMPGVECPE